MKFKNLHSNSYFPISANDVCAIISSYNRKSLLNRAVDSVLSQTCPPGQFIIVDDGSFDDSISLIRQFQKKFPFIQLLSYSKNQGPAFARNFAVQHSHKKIIAFLDSDDAWLPQKLELQLFQIQSSKTLFSCSQESWIRNDVLVHPPKTHCVPPNASPLEIFSLSLQRCILATSTVLLFKDLFIHVGGFNQNLPICEDFELWLRCLAAESFCFVPQNLSIKYGGRPDQVSSQFKRLQPFQISALFSIWIDRLSLPSPFISLLQRELLLKTRRELLNASRHHESLAIQYYQKILHAVETNHLF